MSTYEGEHTIFGLLSQANLEEWNFIYWMYLQSSYVEILTPDVIVLGGEAFGR
jgi:hypothetical protein